MRLLVVHQNFPGQFGHFVKAWAGRPGWDVRGLGRETAPGIPGFPGLVRYRLGRNVRADQHHYLRQMEAATLHGQAAARAMLQLRQSGFTPDVILAHPGWGETLYAKDVFPDTRLVHYCEWYYNADGADLGFDPEFPITFDDRARIRTWNALHTLNLTNCDAAVTPTHWQKSRHPEIFQSKITVQHEGIAVHELGPDSRSVIKTPNGTVLRAGDPVVTYVARNLEPYRGFHIFARALERIQRSERTCHALIVGGDDVSYGKRPHDASSWREQMLREVALDPGRTHFLGRLPRERYIRVLQVSAVHVYLTYPFVLSWSVLEAMACRTPIVASNTEPVREVISENEHGWLVDFFEPSSLCKTVLDRLANPIGSVATRLNAQRRACGFAQRTGVSGYEKILFESRLSGVRPPPKEEQSLSKVRRTHGAARPACTRTASGTQVGGETESSYEQNATR